MGGALRMRRLAGLFRQLGPPRSILAPPTQFSSLGLAGTESTYQGGFLRLAPVLVALPPAPAPAAQITNFQQHPLHPQSDQEVALQTAHTSPGTSQVPTPPPPTPRPLLRGTGQSAGFETRNVTDSPPPCLPRAQPPRPGPARTQLTWKPAQGPPTSLLRIANRTAGVGPPAGHSSASAALAESRGPNVRRGRTGGWLFLGGWETRLIVWGGRAVCGLGRARCCTFRGGKGIGK